MVPVGGGQGRAGHLVDADQQLRCIGRPEDFLDEPVDLRIAEAIDLRERLLLLVQALAQRVRRIGVIEQVPPRLHLHLELGNRQGPGSQGLGQAALQVEEPQQPPGVFRDREFSPKGRLSRGKR